MYSSQPHRMKFRENVSWGYELRYGPKDMEETVARESYSKQANCCAQIGTIGSVFIPCEIRFIADAPRRLIVSVWISSPVKAELSSELKNRLIHLHRTAKRLAEMKAANFFKERFHGETRKEAEVIAGKGGDAESATTGEGQAQGIDW